MKSYKKIGLLLALVAAGLGLFFTQAHKAKAAGAAAPINLTPTQIKAGTYKFIATGGVPIGQCSTEMIVEGTFTDSAGKQQTLDFSPASCSSSSVWEFEAAPQPNGVPYTCYKPGTAPDTIYVHPSPLSDGSAGYSIISTVGATISTINSGPDNSSCTAVNVPDTQITPFQATVTPPVGTTGQAFTDQTIGYDAKSNTTSKLTSSDFSFVDGANIQLKFNGQTIIFTDTHPEDGTFGFKTSDALSNNTPFCSPGDPGGSSGGEINLAVDDKTNNDFAVLSKPTIPLELIFDYYDTSASGGGACKPADIKNFNIDSTNATEILTGTSTGIATIAANPINFALLNGQVYTSGDVNGNCNGDFLVLTGANSGTLYQGSGSKYKAAGTTCTFDTERSVLIEGTPGQANCSVDSSDPACAGSAGVCDDHSTPDATTGKCADGTLPVGTTTPNSCESGYTGPAHEFNWIFCKMLAGLDSLTNTFIGIVQDQLDVCTGTSLTQVSQSCSNNILDNNVQKAWSTFRILATSILVIIMLVMVLSQAIGGGPFDAYTVRKVLPKLVAAAIFIQLSWYAAKFAIDLSNDVGVGIAQLMYWPFGGAGKMSLDNLIGNVGIAGPSFSIAALFTGLAIGYVASGLTIFGVMFLGAGAVLSLIIGLLVLLFRQILIILLVIFVPVALVAWILPGTETYWKMWKDNFIKVLFMFPLIMAMIAGGRIFAQVGSTQGILGLVIVFLGFFGPLWFLPKTFKWGGQAFGSLSSGTLNATKSLRGQPGKYAMAGAKVNREQKAQSRYERLANRSSRFGAVGRNWDTLMAGGFNPTLRPTTRNRRLAAARSEGREAANKAALAAQVGSEFENIDHPDKLEDLDDRAQGIPGRHSGLGGTPEDRLLALNQLARFGDWDRITRMRTDGTIPESVWQRFVAEPQNISDINQKAPHLSPLGSKAQLANGGYEEMATWTDETFKDAVRQAQEAQVRWTGPDDPSRGLRTGTLVDVAVAQGIDPAANPEAAEAARNDYRARMATKATAALADYQVTRRLNDSNISDLTAITSIPLASSQVRQFRGDGGRTRYDLPTGALVAQAGPTATPQQAADMATARSSLTTALSQETGPNGGATSELGRRLADRSGSVPPADLAGYQAYMTQLQTEAANSPEAKRIYNNAVEAYDTAVRERLRNQQQELLAQNSPSLRADVASAYRAARADRALFAKIK